MSDLHHSNFEAMAFGFHGVLAEYPRFADDPDKWDVEHTDAWFTFVDPVENAAKFVGAAFDRMSSNLLVVTPDQRRKSPVSWNATVCGNFPRRYDNRS